MKKYFRGGPFQWSRVFGKKDLRNADRVEVTKKGARGKNVSYENGATKSALCTTNQGGLKESGGDISIRGKVFFKKKTT